MVDLNSACTAQPRLQQPGQAHSSSARAIIASKGHNSPAKTVIASQGHNSPAKPTIAKPSPKQFSQSHNSPA